MGKSVNFGIRNLHYAVMTEGEAITYSTPVSIKGAVSVTMTPEGDTGPFYADDRKFFVTVTNNGYTCELEVANLPDSFFEDVLGNTVSTQDKVMTETADVQPKNFALLFEEGGDGEKTMYALYNCVATRPTRTMNTVSETTTPQTRTLTVTASPSPDTRVTARWTTSDTPEEVVEGWYQEVWTQDTTGA